MRRVIRHVLVLTLSVALLASAAAWRQCTALQMATAAAAGMMHSSHASSHRAQDAGHGGSGHHAMHQQQADGPIMPAADDHGCMKCCSMCTVANALLPAADAAVTFTASAPVFFRDHETWSGNTVSVDPGIPKHIV